MLEAGERETHDIEVAAFDARNETAGATLNGVGTGFVIRFAAGEIARDFFLREGGEVDQGGLDEVELLDVRKADKGDASDDGMGAAGKSFEHVAGVVGGTRSGNRSAEHA